MKSMKSFCFFKEVKVILTIVVISLFSLFQLNAQDEEPVVKKKEKPVRSPFQSGVLIDNQTVVIPSQNTLEMVIQHRFGVMSNGIKDLYGIYAPSNIRIGLNYSIKKNLLVGIGTTKNSKLQDIQWKYNIIEQTRSGSIPLSVSYYGNFVIEATPDDNFGQTYQFSNRLSYFHQIIVARKINSKISFQLAPSYFHFNMVDSAAYPNIKNDNFGLSFSGRVKFAATTAVLFEYNLPLFSWDNLSDVDSEYPKPSLGFGIEIGTSSHAFQIFVASYQSIIYQKNFLYNTNALSNKDILLGFNITRLWNF